MTAMLTNEIYDKGYADGYENGRMSKEPVFFPPCEDCNKKMDEVRKAYDRRNAQISDTIAELEKLKAKIGKCRDYIIVNHNNTEADMNRLDGINLVAAIIDERIAELKGENK